MKVCYQEKGQNQFFFSFLLFLQIVLQKLSECDTNVLPKENIVYDDDDTVVTPVQSTNSLQKKEVCV